MRELSEEDLRREQRLAVIEFQVQALQAAIQLMRQEEHIERIPPQPERRAGLRVVKAG